MSWLSKITRGAPAYPLVVLAGLNLVDEFDRTAFNVLIPSIRDHFSLELGGVLALVAIVGLAVIVIELPIAYFADRSNRVRLALGGAVVWAGFSLLTGLATVTWVLAAARAGSGIGRSVVSPTHNSLLADYYDVDARNTVFAFHRGANALGMFLGPMSAGVLAYYFSWRAPFIIFVFPTLVFVLLALRLREPTRGAHERRAVGASEDNATTEEVPPSYAEAWRILWQVRTLRRIWYSLPFLGTALIGVGSLTSLFYEEVFGLNDAVRGFVTAAVEPAQIVGLFVMVPVVVRMAERNPGASLRVLAFSAVFASIGIAVFALAQTLAVAVIGHALIVGSLSIVGPGALAALSLAIPPRARAMGFSVGSLWLLPALVFLPILGAIGDAWGLRVAILVMVPVFVVGAALIVSASSFMVADVHRVRTSSVAQASARAARLAGDPKALIIRELDVSYGQTQVLFSVDLEVSDGELIALLGTNGAGKSTLLKAIVGSVPAQQGVVIFDGRDITQLPPELAAAAGIIIVPGGKGVFPGLTVSENLELAGWLYGRDRSHVETATKRVLDYFPILKERWDRKAGDLSGGEQQMLTLGQAFIARPKMLMIDELSLGLAPTVIEQLLGVVRAIHEEGTTIILVEQSVNLALTVAHRALFMEKGEIRFDGPTGELLQRPEILRSVFLEGATAAGDGRIGATARGGRAHRRLPRRDEKGKPPANDLASSAGSEARASRPALSVRHLSVSYAGIRAVTGVNLDLEDGQILGLIGPNGAGKTTIFDVISGFVVPDDGRIEFNGIDITRWPPDARARAGLGRSFQDARLFPTMTVREVVATALERWVETPDPLAAAVVSPATRMSEVKIARRVDDLIELMNLSAFSNKFVRELSTGSRRIVDLACVVAHEPSIILLDEPSSGIAQRETEALGPVLRNVRAMTGASLLVIEHDMPLITSIVDSIVALDLGEVVTQGPPQYVQHHPRVIESYLGSSEAVIQRSGGRPQG